MLLKKCIKQSTERKEGLDKMKKNKLKANIICKELQQKIYWIDRMKFQV